MRHFRWRPSWLLAGASVIALGASVWTASSFHQALERSEGEFATLSREAIALADRAAQDRARLEAAFVAERTRLEAAFVVERARFETALIVERDRARQAVEMRDRLVADQARRLEDLKTEYDESIAALAAERERAIEERDSLVAQAAAERAQMEADRDAALAEDAERHRQLIADRDGALAMRDQSRSERDQARAERDAVMADARTMIGDLDADTRRTVADVERIIVATGLAASSLVPEPNRLRRVGARGGPYIPWKEQVALADHPEGVQPHAVMQQLDRLKALRDVMVRLPLVAPVTHAILSDGFGYRWDPINGRGARHDGLDLRAVRDSAAYAPAAGTVIFAGWDGAYGYTIEIDHGFGVTTRYSHLSKMLVAKGDVVSAREHIGVVGATGRATGTHLHYEIRLDGAPRNPMRFLQAVHVERDAFAGFGPR